MMLNLVSAGLVSVLLSIENRKPNARGSKKMKLRNFTMLILAPMAFAKPASDIAVTSILADYDAVNTAY